MSTDPYRTPAATERAEVKTPATWAQLHPSDVEDRDRIAEAIFVATCCSDVCGPQSGAMYGILAERAFDAAEAFIERRRGRRR